MYAVKTEHEVCVQWVDTVTTDSVELNFKQGIYNMYKVKHKE